MSKTLYHSELYKAGDTEIEILGKVRESKYRGQPDYIPIMFDGEERYYQIENDEIASFFDNYRKGDLVVVRADGRGDEATLEEVAGERRGASRGPTQARDTRRGTTRRPPEREEEPPPEGEPPPRREAAPPPPKKTRAERENDARVLAKVHLAKTGTLWSLCWDAAVYQAGTKQITIETSEGLELIRSLATSLFIESQDARWVEDLPLVLPKGQTGTPPTDAPPPPTEPPPPPEPAPEDDVPF